MFLRMWVSATSYPLAVDLTGNRAYIPDSAATVLEQRMRMADGYSHEGITKKSVPKSDTCPCYLGVHNSEALF